MLPGTVVLPGTAVFPGTVLLAGTGAAAVGALRFSFAQPIKSRPQDKIERFQFQLGKVF